ncbi:MAG TPA: hypothetical protein VNU19_11470, partial [Candidatus Acidoferrum sp.]|nr:hypothetical protein [Candidatus Acidoferrum sp.]
APRARTAATTPKTNTKKALISVPRLGNCLPIERPGRIGPVDQLFIPVNGRVQAKIDGAKRFFIRIPENATNVVMTFMELSRTQ